MKKSYQSLLFLLFPFLLIDLTFFSMSYFGRGVDFYVLLVTHCLASIGVSFKLRTIIFKKLIFIVLSFFANTVVSIALLFSTMYLPGSKEHNYVMYSVCLPAMREYYGINEGQSFPSIEFEKDGFGKWWYQHVECEKNVYAGKGPLFSESPPGFTPIKGK